jgi:DNA-binding GntR family transcriptional regulator
VSSSPPLLQPAAGEARSLSVQAYFRIRELIVSLELQPGSIVDERALMARLGIGRTPVREALRLLAREGLVEIHPRRGMFVSSVEVGDLAALSEVRAVLESLAARLAAERRTAEDEVRTVELLDELAGGGSLDERALFELDQRLHRHVWRCAHNAFLEETLDAYFVLTLRIWLLAIDRVSRLDRAVQEHRELLEAIRDGDADAAADAMLRHVHGFERAIRAVL